MILLIDNYDSFVFNLARYFQRLDQETHVVRNDAIDPAGVRRLQPDAVVLSPGPCTPREAGSSLEIAGEFYRELPLLGVCLGHQAIAEALGGRIERADEPMHGRTSPIEHTGERLFAGVPSPFVACRYHSLVVDPGSLPAELVSTAWVESGPLMAFEHREHLVFGLQFHPEAVLSEHGYRILANFLRLAGLNVAGDVDQLSAEEDRSPRPKHDMRPPEPVTF